ncbi:E3 ubiquitin-protein ligase RNF34 isoform X1 [Hylaeus anthracinus]|uniref:E3 ubiquitin-protein ligase RNF34 isoform X1 n=1 Tax=Hylaeus anthracinus TaxID=313031 RepID=UPI0023B9E60E|nr:E3 ubiquitin-protein ligase RNF34 isoform X1 [Hylaeus anthracinus]
MACEACNTKFSFFTRKKQCSDCLRYFCSECVIKRMNKILSCDSCSLLSRRPLIRSQIMEMRSKDLRQYLLGKKVSIKGCIEKEDLIELVIIFANGTSNYKNAENRSSTSSRMANEKDERTREFCSQSHEPSAREHSQEHEPSAQECETSSMRNDPTEIIEVPESTPASGEISEPVISEVDDTSDIFSTHNSDAITNIPMWPDNVKLSDLNDLSDLEYLTVKQLKNLLSINRVDYKGCIERCELLDRASRLWQEHKQSKDDVKIMDENLCKICWDEPMECVILECGHVACCLNCGKQMSECPICKQYVVRVVRFFKV